MTQSKVHYANDHDTYTNSYSAKEQQIRLDAMLSRQMQTEEQKCLAEHIKQIENKRSLEYQHNQRRDQIIPNPLLQIDVMMISGQESIMVKKGLKIQD